jgi:hypothetical protein
MVRTINPALARSLAGRIEHLPDHVNDPHQMPFVQGVLGRAFGQLRSDRSLVAEHLELRGDPHEAEQYRQPVKSIALSDDDKRALREGFECDETGVFEEIEHDAAEVGEWLKNHRHPRDAERFREYLKFVCGEIIGGWGLAVEIRPGVFNLDLASWETEAAKPLCDYLRELADGIESEPPPRDPMGVSLRDVASCFHSDDAIIKRTIRRMDGSKQMTATKIGKCRLNGRAQLYKLSEILSDAEKILALDSDEKASLDRHLRSRLRRPAPG